MSKPRVIRAYDRLDDALLEQIKLYYPNGFERHLVRFTDVNGKIASALPFETDEKYYLIKMTKSEAVAIIEDDDDYDDDGVLTDEAREEYSSDGDEEFEEADIDPDELSDEDTSDGDDD